MITHLESDILECKVKWALGSITRNKASGGDAILAELFQILNNVSVKSAALNGTKILHAEWHGQKKKKEFFRDRKGHILP